MPQSYSESIWSLTILGVCALIGATITAGVTSSIPHDMVGIGVAVVGYIMGRRVGQLGEQAKWIRQNGDGGNGSVSHDSQQGR